MVTAARLANITLTNLTDLRENAELDAHQARLRAMVIAAARLQMEYEKAMEADRAAEPPPYEGPSGSRLKGSADASETSAFYSEGHDGRSSDGCLWSTARMTPPRNDLGSRPMSRRIWRKRSRCWLSCGVGSRRTSAAADSSAGVRDSAADPGLTRFPALECGESGPLRTLA